MRLIFVRGDAIGNDADGGAGAEFEDLEGVSDVDCCVIGFLGVLWNVLPVFAIV